MKKKQVVSHYNYKMALIQKHRYSCTPIPYPHHPTIHAIRYFLVGIICGRYRASFPVRDHLWSNLGIICGPGSFAVLGSFADPYRPRRERHQTNGLMSKTISVHVRIPVFIIQLQRIPSK